MSIMKRHLLMSVFSPAVFSLAQSSAAQSTCAPSSHQLIIYHAGSLSAAFTPVEKLFTQQMCENPS